MNKVAFLFVFLIILIFTILGCSRKEKDKSAPDGYYISTQSRDEILLKKLNMDKPSENASDILDVGKLTIPTDKQDEKTADTVRGKIIDEFNQDAIIVLTSDTSFKGKLVWDVLQSVGLKWGDGDLFHWGNFRRDYGDDQFFSVWTTTEPGYFLPEQIKSGQMNPRDLVFGFSVPRNADPKNVFPIMVNVVKYCQKRLGGKILDKNKQSFNEDESMKNLEFLIENMKKHGIVPGSDKALITY